MKVDDCVIINDLPASFEGKPSEQQQVYRKCVGLKMFVDHIDDLGHCSFDLGQMWDHFPNLLPFESSFEEGCLQKMEPLFDAEWLVIGDLFERNVDVPSEVVAASDGLLVSLPGGVEAEVPREGLRKSKPVGSYLGEHLSVRLISVSKRRRELVAYPTEYFTSGGYADT